MIVSYILNIDAIRLNPKSKVSGSMLNNYRLIIITIIYQSVKLILLQIWSPCLRLTIQSKLYFTILTGMLLGKTTWDWILITSGSTSTERPNPLIQSLCLDCGNIKWSDGGSPDRPSELLDPSECSDDKEAFDDVRPLKYGVLLHCGIDILDPVRLMESISMYVFSNMVLISCWMVLAISKVISEK